MQAPPSSSVSHPVSSATRRERATSVLLADPCFQLRSICYLLGQPEPPAPGTALPVPDRKRFSLQSCEWARAGSGARRIWGISRAKTHRQAFSRRHQVFRPL